MLINTTDIFGKEISHSGPLTDLATGPKNKKIEWKDEHERALKVHTDASDYQLGAVISQNNKPIAFFSMIGT